MKAAQTRKKVKGAESVDVGASAHIVKWATSINKQGNASKMNKTDKHTSTQLYFCIFLYI